MSAEPAADRTTRGPVGSVIHAVDILRYVAAATTPEGVTAIARALGISPSSCFNILKTLVQQDLLEFNAKTKTYSLGMETLRIARRVLDENGVMEFVRADLLDLAHEFGVTTAVWRLTSRGRWVLVGLAESSARVRIHLSVGQRTPMYAGALGRIAAAFGDIGQDDLKAELDKVVWRNPVGSSRVDLQACKLEYSIVSPK